LGADYLFNGYNKWEIIFLKKINSTEYTKQQSEVTEKTRNSWNDNVRLFRM